MFQRKHDSDSVAPVAIVGGGITALSAAWALQTKALVDDYVVFEQAAHWGGKIQTERIVLPGIGTFIVEAGPESFITRKPEAWHLAHHLGLGDDVVDTGNEARDVFILSQGQPLAVPLSPPLFVQTPLLSWRGKLRMLAEPFVPPRTDPGDESLADFVTRRLGREALEQFMGPILAGIYNTNPDYQSVLTTSAVMREMEAEHGSLVKGAMARVATRRRERQTGVDLPPRSISLQHGAASLVNALTDQLTGSLQLNTGVTEVRAEPGRYVLSLADGRVQQARAVLLATPANVAANLLHRAAPEAAGDLARIRHTNLGTMSLVYRQSDLKDVIPFRGLMIPRREQRAIDAVTWSSKKFPTYAPPGYALLRVFFGGARPDMVITTGATLQSVVQRELAALLNIKADPLATRTYRWPAGYPQADVGHLERVAAIEAALPPGLFVAGSPYRGLGVPDCIRQGQESALAVSQYLRAAKA